MAFEQTSSKNPYNITKRQHFHMQAILKRFAQNNLIKVTTKHDQAVQHVDAMKQCFMGRRAWSEECESHISHPIERKFLAQIRRIENNEQVCDHQAISEYHLLWHLRYHYAKNEADDYDLYNDLPCGTLDKETEELIESWGKVPIRSGGKIAGRFKATLDIKELLSINADVYKGHQWQVVKSNGVPFISADCYCNNLVMAVSPRILLIASKKPDCAIYLASNDEVKELNDNTIELSNEFYIG